MCCLRAGFAGPADVYGPSSRDALGCPTRKRRSNFPSGSGGRVQAGGSAAAGASHTLEILHRGVWGVKKKSTGIGTSTQTSRPIRWPRASCIFQRLVFFQPCSGRRNPCRDPPSSRCRLRWSRLTIDVMGHNSKGAAVFNVLITDCHANTNALREGYMVKLNCAAARHTSLSSLLLTE